MGSVKILDCTLRDGGYINDWNFGEEAIKYIVNKLGSTGIDFIEVGFLKNVQFDSNRTVFPSVDSISDVIMPKRPNVEYVGMIDMSAPIDCRSIPPRGETTIDALRVIFKQDRINEGYDYIKNISGLGYKIMVQLVSTNTYTDEELISTFNKFNELHPYSVYIVDSLGMIRRKDFLRMIYLADNNLDRDIAIGYHAHNNLQQAMGNAESFVELFLNRDILIDACISGMGRGAGNLNLELFCKYLNENYGKNYHIEPMLEIMDEYLNDIYAHNFWGYSLPYYLSASNGCHPNYAKYYNEKGTLTEKSFNELLSTIDVKDKPIFSKELAEKYYLRYMENYVNDHDALQKLQECCNGRRILIVAPGDSVNKCDEYIQEFIRTENPLIISIAHVPEKIIPDLVFCSNLRRYEHLKGCGIRKLLTSNLGISESDSLIFNYSSYLSKNYVVSDNAGLMVLKILQSSGLREVFLAGMDGQPSTKEKFFAVELYNSNKPLSEQMNEAMREEINRMRNQLDIKFITPTQYAE